MKRIFMVLMFPLEVIVAIIFWLCVIASFINQCIGSIGNHVTVLQYSQDIMDKIMEENES